MPDKSGRNYRNTSNSRREKPKPRYFSPKPGKADRKAIKEKLAVEPAFVLDFLAGITSNERIYSLTPDEDGSYAFFYNLGSSPDGDSDRIVGGRASTLLNAIAIVAHWVQTLSMEFMFPEDEEEDSL